MTCRRKCSIVAGLFLAALGCADSQSGAAEELEPIEGPIQGIFEVVTYQQTQDCELPRDEWEPGNAPFPYLAYTTEGSGSSRVAWETGCETVDECLQSDYVFGSYKCKDLLWKQERKMSFINGSTCTFSLARKTLYLTEEGIVLDSENHEYKKFAESTSACSENKMEPGKLKCASKYHLVARPLGLDD